MTIDLSRWDATALGAAWRETKPFGYVILDDFLPAARLQALREAVSREPHLAESSDTHEVMVAGPPLRNAALRELEGDLASPEWLAFLAAATGKKVGTISMRSYVYLAGSYLLPHADHRRGVGRLLAYAYYLVGSDSFKGGELELFECDMDGEEVLATRPALTIEPRANRFVFFDVAFHSLHQVREVLEGGRVSLSGWWFK